MEKDILKERMERITDSIAAVGQHSGLSKCLGAVVKAANITDSHDRGVVAQLLQNYKRTVMDKVADSVDGTTRGQQVNTMADFGPFVPEVLPIIMAWYPEMPLKDLISIQPMKQALDYLVFSKLVTGTNKAPTLVGQEVETPLGIRKIDGRYPTGVIYGEQFPSEQLEVEDGKLIGATVYYALRASEADLNRFKLTVHNAGTDTVYRAMSVVGDNLQLCLDTDRETPVEGALWNIASGAFYLPTTAADTTGITVTANYCWNLDFAVDENIPKVKEQVEYFPMEAMPRVLAFQWTIFADAIRKAQFGTDIRQENTKRILNLLYQYQVRFILDEMYEDAQGNLGTITVPRNGIYAMDVQLNNVLTQLNTAATNIAYASGLQSGNRLVVGANFKNWVESLPNTMFQRSDRPRGYLTAYELGRLGDFIVYFDPKRKADEIMMSYKGEEWYMAPYYLGVFLPLVPTDAITINVTVRQAFADMCAYKYQFPQFVSVGKFEFADVTA